MKEYTDLLRRILKTGRLKKNRTGIDTISLLGPQMEFDMDDGFPLLTERAIFFRGVVVENLWFIGGVCNNQDLMAQDVKIWDNWALKEPTVRDAPRHMSDVLNDYVTYRKGMLEGEEAMAFDHNKAIAELEAADMADMEAGLPVNRKPLDATHMDQLQGGYKLLREANVSFTSPEIVQPIGDLGPVYGVLWRGWIDHNGQPIDQFMNIFEKLASENPKLRYSRANIITAYNPGVLPDETVGAQENIRNGRQALAACHTMFQFFAEPMTLEERYNLYLKKLGRTESEPYDNIMNLARSIQPLLDAGESTDEVEDLLATTLDERHVPRDQLSLKLYQRSADFPIGVPFNIAGYALLLHMFAAQLKMKPAKFIHTFGDAHIYVNQLDGVKELLNRVDNFEIPALPELLIDPDVKSILEYKFEHFKLVGYTPIKPQISFGDIAV